MKRLILPAFLILFSITAGFFSCKKDAAPKLFLGYDYFPNTVGKYIIYDVDSIVCSSLDYKVDTFSYQLKELVQSIFMDNSNRPTMRIERYIRNFHKDSCKYDALWTLKNIWTANRTVTDAEKVESNVRYVKLTFPVKANATWNGNADNTLGEWDYNYTIVNQPQAVIDTAYPVAGTLCPPAVATSQFDSVLTVLQVDCTSVISKKYYLEKYAANIGLIYKEVIDVIDERSTIWNGQTPILQRDSIAGTLKYEVRINTHN